MIRREGCEILVGAEVPRRAYPADLAIRQRGDPDGRVGVGKVDVVEYSDRSQRPEILLGELQIVGAEVKAAVLTGIREAASGR